MEAGDFGAAPRSTIRRPRTAASARCSRAASGARASIRERRTLARIAPWLLRPLPFLVGTYRSVARAGWRSAPLSRSTAGWAAIGTTASSRSCTCPAPRLVSKAATLKLFPGVRPEQLTGGAQWYDYQMVEDDRLTLAFAAAADRAGADLANYVEAIAPLRRDRIGGIAPAIR